ncbi:MAG: methyltransferase domain-containing protein, partial [Gemmatimonadota bacterium]
MPPFSAPDLSRRVLQGEAMDEPGLDPMEHRRALRALALVNCLSLTAGRIWNEIRRQAADAGSRPLRLLDVACGGGDTIRQLKRRASRVGIPLDAHGCDVSPRALTFAREQASRAGVEVTFFELDALGSPIPSGYDLVCSTLFLHHLTEDQVVGLLAGMAGAGRTLLVQDLLRTRAGYCLAWSTLRLLSRSRVAQVDGPRSVLASFRIPEMAALARIAGLSGARITPCWPQRFCLSWSR